MTFWGFCGYRGSILEHWRDFWGGVLGTAFGDVSGSILGVLEHFGQCFRISFWGISRYSKVAFWDILGHFRVFWGGGLEHFRVAFWRIVTLGAISRHFGALGL